MRKLTSLLLCCIIFMSAALGESVLSPVSSEAFPTEGIANEKYTPSAKDTVIILNNDTAQITGSGAVLGDNTLTINQSGSYYLSGSFFGQILIDSADTEKVSLILNGVTLTNMNDSPLLIIAAGKNVTISLADNSINVLSCTFLEDVLNTDGAYDAALFSKADLKFKASGSMYITCHGGKAINCRDDIEVLSGNLFISATDDGMRGKDSVSISGGQVQISAGADGIRSNNEEKEGKGFITVSGGKVFIDATLDALQAYNTLTVSGGEIQIKTGGGAGSGNSVRNDDMTRGGWGGGKGWDMDKRNSASDESAQSAKGLKSSTNIIISGGSITADCKDDALHSDLDMTISGGQMILASGDDGIHADNALYLQGGDILVSQSYEGLEAADLQISGGETRLYASDDGINAAGGEKDTSANDSDGSGGSRGGMGFLSTTNGTLLMSGGYVLVNCNGDGIDVNGSAEMTAGLMIVYGPTSGANGALDYDGVFTVSGGTLLASGSSGMAQAVTASGDISMLAFTCNMAADTLLHIRNKSGEEMLTFKSPKKYSCVIFACEQLVSGTDYEIYANGSCDTEEVDGYYALGSYSPGTLLGTLSP